jgi:hypothetical protein
MEVVSCGEGFRHRNRFGIKGNPYFLRGGEDGCCLQGGKADQRLGVEQQ